MNLSLIDFFPFQVEVSKSEINETFKVFSALLEERKSELMRELDGMYTSKQVAMSVYSQKAQEVVDKIFQVSFFAFIDATLLIPNCTIFGTLTERPRYIVASSHIKE